MPEMKKYLNRDGLEEYNSLLPHSSAEMQSYVNDWLDEHPEATTTVQDGAITEPKLADKSVSLRTLADDTVHMLKGMMITGNLSGEVLTADDAYSAPPVALTVDGKSTQNGTPTPDAPVEIVSVEQVNLTLAGSNLLDMSEFANFSNWNTSGTYAGFTVNVPNGNIIAKYDGAVYHEANVYLNIIAGSTASVNGRFLAHVSSSTGNSTQTVTTTTNTITFGLFPKNAATLQKIISNIGSTLRVVLSANTAYSTYDGTSVLLNLTQELRSLPDGTHDTLSFAYLRPSTREGWAWYSRELVQRVGGYVFPDGFTFGPTPTDMGDGWYRFVRYSVIRDVSSNSSGLCDRFLYVPASSVKSEHIYLSTGGATLLVTQMASVADANNAVIGATLLYLCTPITTQLDPIELPVLPAPNCTVWADPSTGLRMRYVRDGNIVIQRIEEAIADQ